MYLGTGTVTAIDERENGDLILDGRVLLRAGTGRDYADVSVDTSAQSLR